MKKLYLNISEDNKKFGIMEFLIYAVASLIYGFIVLFYNDSGFTESEIGILMSATMVATMIAQPAAGYISENILSFRKIIMIYIAIGFSVIAMVPFFKGNFAAMLIFFMIYSFTGRCLPSVCDVFVTKMSRRYPNLDYGFVRGIGSFGYAFFALAGGFLISAFGFNILFFLACIFLLVSFISFLFLPDLPVEKREKKAKESALKNTISSLLKNKVFIISLIAIFFTQFGINGYFTYLGLFMKSIGGGSSDLGISLALLAFFEIPFLWNYNKIRRRFSVDKLMMTALVVLVFRILIPTLAENKTLVVALQITHALYSGIFIPSVLIYFQSLAEERVASTAVLFSISIYTGLSSIMSSLIGGFFIENMGVRNFYFFSAAIAALGAVLFAISLVIKNKYSKRILL